MTLMPAVIEPSIEFCLETYEQAKEFQANLVWKKLDEITLEEALSHWFFTLAIRLKSITDQEFAS